MNHSSPNSHPPIDPDILSRLLNRFQGSTVSLKRSDPVSEPAEKPSTPRSRRARRSKGSKVKEAEGSEPRFHCEVCHRVLALDGLDHELSGLPTSATICTDCVKSHTRPVLRAQLLRKAHSLNIITLPVDPASGLPIPPAPPLPGFSPKGEPLGVPHFTRKGLDLLSRTTR